MYNLNRVFNHDRVMQIRERIFMSHSFQEQFINIIVLDALRHFLIEVPWLPRTFDLYVDFYLALVAELFTSELSSIIRTKPLVDSR